MTIKNLKKFAIIGVFLLSLCWFAGCGNSQELPESNGDFQAITVADKSIQKIDSLIEEYHDNYAVYYQVDEYNDLLENISGSYVGIGVYIYENEENGRVTVMSAMKGGPAY